MGENYQQIAARMKDISALAQAAGVVGWDHETMMPERGSAARAEQSAALSAVIHEKLIDPSLGDSLRQLAADPSPLSDDERVCVREWLRDHEKSARLPADLVREMSRVASLAQDAWIKARRKSDFAAFAPWLEKTIDLKRRQADAMGYEGVPYDALLDDYEPRMTVAELDPIVGELQKGLVPIVAAIRDSGVIIDTKPLLRRYPERDQEALLREVMAAMGIDIKASRLDRSAHPFCCGIAPTDVRITTRYNERLLTQSLYGVIHESGHALYEQGFEEKNLSTPLAEAVSLGVHESQSRLWENMIGRSRPFVSFLLPRLKKRFARQLKGVGAEKFWHAINRVVPSPIRVEADEATYNLHVVLRYEIEKALIAKETKVGELPAFWNSRMEGLLGIRPKNDAEGVLQDTHWAQGGFGYFPTYLLGNLYAAQLWATIRKQVRNVDGKMAAGDFSTILAWLRDRIHRHGRRYAPAELIARATGEKPDARFFLAYLRKKFGGIYRIKW
ncbi:MAG: carboxypeptidase M32 [Pseudomonadota bacterium]